jgi:hypothetical protein
MMINILQGIGFLIKSWLQLQLIIFNIYIQLYLK